MQKKIVSFMLIPFITSCISTSVYFLTSQTTLVVVSPLPQKAYAEVIIHTPSLTPTPQPTAIPTAIPTVVPSSTPSPTTPPSIVVAPGDLESFFSQYSGEYGVDKELLKRIAKCESGMNTNATHLDYVGLFQFATQSWISARQAMGHPTDPGLRTNAEESIRTGAYTLSKRGTSPWPSCGK